MLTAGFAILNAPPSLLSLSITALPVIQTAILAMAFLGSTVTGGRQVQVAPQEEAGENAGWLQRRMIIILFVILERG